MTSFLFSVWQLWVSCCEEPFLTWRWVCNLLVQLLLGLARGIALGPKFHRTQTIFYCSFETPQLGQVKVKVTLRPTVSQSVCLGVQPNLGLLTTVCFLSQVHIFISPRNRKAQYLTDILALCPAYITLGRPSGKHRLSTAACCLLSRIIAMSMVSMYGFRLN
jgi:hypothetical protein